MLRFIAGRVAQGIAALFVVSIIVFALARIGGDPADVLLPITATQADYDRLYERWGFDRPYYVQYFSFVGNALRGDFGDSFAVSGRSAMGLVLSRLPATLALASASIIIATIIALPMGVWTALRKDTKFDQVGKALSVFGQSAPQFWFGLILMWWFAVGLGWFRTSGFNTYRDLVLPGITLGWYNVAVLMRLTRSGMLETLDTEYIKLARLKGLSERRVVWLHAFRNAAIVPLGYFGIILAILITGAVVVETVFSWPGTGRLAVDAVRQQDYPVVQAVAILFTALYIGSNLLIDVVYAYIDPRIRRS